MIFSFSQPVWEDMLRGAFVIQDEDNYIVLKYDKLEVLPRPTQQRSVLIKHVVLPIVNKAVYPKATWSSDARTAGDYGAIYNFLKNRNNHTTSDWNCIRNTCSAYDIANNRPMYKTLFVYEDRKERNYGNMERY